MEELKNQLSQLLNKTEWTEEEKQWLLEYLNNNEPNELQDLLHQQFEENLEQPQLLDEQKSRRILAGIYGRISVKKQKNKSALLKMWTIRIAAACVIGLLILNTYSVFKNHRIENTKNITKKEEKYKLNGKDVPPGSNKALLTLADGSTIYLDDAANGQLVQQGTTSVLKINGQLTYNASNAADGEVFYNTISTPRGGQYVIVLPDNSRVWLNAASSLRFPTLFKGKERRVEITGEAYFEVAKNKEMPFTVKVKNAEVRVLGTHFNIMAYEQESLMKTTLVEGAVTFINGSNSNILKPGQEARLSKNGEIKVENDVDLSEVVAWKNGLFHFEKADIQKVMRQLSLWYDIEVVYGDNKIKDLFYADIPRNTTLSVVLKALELTSEVKFEIEGRKVIVN
ncbi:MAG: FecR family protein [Segetibacter sp.]|nr:FecR family protein [Segetibacter sp.]